MSPTPVIAQVITVSDRCHAGTQEDRSGPVGAQILIGHGMSVGEVAVVPDDVDEIRRAVTRAIDDGARFLLTTGGTGVGPRDVTPEALDPLITIDIPGLAELVRARGTAATPFAALSRGRVGLTGRGPGAVLIAAAPGSTGGVRDTANVLAPLVDHVLGQAAGGAH